MKVKAIVGSAHNQLKEECHCSLFKEKSIAYTSNDIVNAGGLVQVMDELYGANKQE